MVSFFLHLVQNEFLPNSWEVWGPSTARWTDKLGCCCFSYVCNSLFIFFAPWACISNESSSAQNHGTLTLALNKENFSVLLKNIVKHENCFVIDFNRAQDLCCKNCNLENAIWNLYEGVRTLRPDSRTSNHTRTDLETNDRIMWLKSRILTPNGVFLQTGGVQVDFTELDGF